jgi:hypothetical protein
MTLINRFVEMGSLPSFGQENVIFMLLHYTASRRCFSKWINFIIGHSKRAPPSTKEKRQELFNDDGIDVQFKCAEFSIDCKHGKVRVRHCFLKKSFFDPKL